MRKIMTSKVIVKAGDDNTHIVEKDFIANSLFFRTKSFSSMKITNVSVANHYDHLLIQVYLQEAPARIDFEHGLDDLWFLSDEEANTYPKPYHLFPQSISETIWRKEVMPVKDSQS